MKIRRTTPAPNSLKLAMTQRERAVPQTVPKDVPVHLMGYETVSNGGNRDKALRGAAFATTPEGPLQLHQLAKSPRIETMRSGWELIKPAVPPALRRGVTSAWLAFDTGVHISKWRSMALYAGPADYAELLLGGANTALGWAELAADIQDYDTTGIKNAQLVLGYGSAGLGGKNLKWMSFNDNLKKNSELYAVGLRFGALMDAGLSNHPAFENVTVQPLEPLITPGKTHLLAGLYD